VEIAVYQPGATRGTGPVKGTFGKRKIEIGSEHKRKLKTTNWEARRSWGKKELGSDMKGEDVRWSWKNAKTRSQRKEKRGVKSGKAAERREKNGKCGKG